MKKICSTALVLIFLALTYNGFALGDIEAWGGWTLTIGETDLTGGPGSDLRATYQSANNATSITVRNTDGGAWRVDVSKADSNWPAAFQLSVRRTSTGTGSGSITGGQSYQLVTDTELSFFSGAADRNGVRVQYRLQGVSVTVPADAYNTTVTYTLVAN